MSPAAAVFHDIWVIVHDGVYEPAEDTFLLCEQLNVSPGEQLLEIGTGCGLVSIVAAKAGANVVATDLSQAAVQNARDNVARHNLQEQIEVRLGYLFEPIQPRERFSLIAFNPPYLPSSYTDPGFDSAWSGGPTGRSVTEAFLAQCSEFLSDDGRLLITQSSLSDPNQTHQILKQHFLKTRIKAEKRFFFEELFLFEARNPRR